MVSTTGALDPQSQLTGLAAAIAALHALPAADADGRRALETECALRVQVIEQQLRDREFSLKESAQAVDTEIRRGELDLKGRTAQRDQWANPLTVGVIVAALGLVGNFVNGLWTNLNQQNQLENQRKTERIKLENELIKEAIKPSDEKERAKSLVFFAKNGLITLDRDIVGSLVQIAGTEQPVPGSSSVVPRVAEALSYSDSIVGRVVAEPRKGLPVTTDTKRSTGHEVRAIILHDAVGQDAIAAFIRSGNATLPGPLAHWLVKSDGTIVNIASETVKANHIGRSKDGLNNANTIGVIVTGAPALKDARQTEALVRLVLDISRRWELAPEKILSHAEVVMPPSRKVDMQQQTPAVRDMVRAALKHGIGKP